MHIYKCSHQRHFKGFCPLLQEHLTGEMDFRGKAAKLTELYYQPSQIVHAAIRILVGIIPDFCAVAAQHTPPSFSLGWGAERVWPGL